jgi:hypothetical protein
MAPPAKSPPGFMITKEKFPIRHGFSFVIMDCTPTAQPGGRMTRCGHRGFTRQKVFAANCLRSAAAVE